MTKRKPLVLDPKVPWPFSLKSPLSEVKEWPNWTRRAKDWFPYRDWGIRSEDPYAQNPGRYVGDVTLASLLSAWVPSSGLVRGAKADMLVFLAKKCGVRARKTEAFVIARVNETRVHKDWASCSVCQFSTKDGRLLCRRNPPTAGGFPRMQANGWCGEFKNV